MKFWLNRLLATGFVFFFMWALDKITEFNLFNAFDPIGQALEDFELTDYAISHLREAPDVDERIVLVNIGNLSRAGIAEQIRIISQYNPLVIGVDGFFNCEGGLRDSINCPQLNDTMGNLLLANAIQEAGNVVLVSKLLQTTKTFREGLVDVYDSIEYSDELFQTFADHGFANLATDARYQDDVKICRSFVPTMEVNGKTELAFGVKLAMAYDSARTEEFLAREKEEEVINFRGNVEAHTLKLRNVATDISTTEFTNRFTVIDVQQVFNQEFTPSAIEGKIVIMGYLGDYFGDPSWNDKFFTPLNKKVAGRANPDMFGVVIHANIVSMILDGDFVDELEDWKEYIIAFILCFLNVTLFFYINDRFPVWFDSVSLSLQILEIVLLMGLTIWVFTAWSFKLDLTLTIGTVALSGPVFEFYDNVMISLVQIWRKRRLTKRMPEVLTSQKEEVS